MIAPDRVLDNS